MGNPKSGKMYGVQSADPIAIGDMVWFDKRTQTVKAFSHADAWTGSTAGSQGKVAENFVGFAASAHTANDATITLVRIEAKGVFGVALSPAAIVEVGDLVTATKDPAGNLLFAGTVSKGALGAADEPTPATQTIAIGKVAKRYTIATSAVEIEIVGVREAGAGPRQYLVS